MTFLKNIVLFTFFVLAAPAWLPGQCFDPLVKQGLYLMQQQNPSSTHYKQAIDKFIAARFCLDSRPSVNLDSLIRLAQGAWVGGLEQARQQAITRKNQSDSLLFLAEQLKVEASQYADKARRAAIEAEASRLALVAENEIRAGHYQDALDLAFMAIQLSQIPTGTPQDEIALTFGRAVFYQKSQLLFNSPAPIDFFQVLPGQGGLLIALNDGSLYWASPNGQSSRALGSHSSPIRSIAVSPDGRYALSCAASQAPLLWDLPGFAQPIVLKGHKEDVLGAVFAPDGSQALTWSRDKTAMLWNLNGQLLATFSGHRGSLYEGSFSPDGRHILTRSSDRSARIWTLDGALQAELAGNGGYLYSACFSPDGTTILTAGADSLATLWNLDGQPLQTFGPNPNVVKEARFITGGQMIVSRPLKNNLQTWHTDGRPLALLSKGEAPSGMLFHPGESTFLSWTDAGSIRLWTPDGQCLLALENNEPILMPPSWSDEGNWVLASSESGATRLWGRDGQLRLFAPGTASTGLPARFAPDGKSFILAINNQQLFRCPIPDVEWMEMKHGPPLPKGRQLSLSERFLIPPLIIEIIELSRRATP